MASITIQNIDPSLEQSLSQSAARHGRSIEEEARLLLQKSLMQEKSSCGLGSRISQRFNTVGGVDLPNVSHLMPRIKSSGLVG
ncbi:MAG: plasmid stabilization protein [Thiohalomonadales bacterium]